MAKSKWWLNPSGPHHSAPHRVTSGSAKSPSKTVVAPKNGAVKVVPAITVSDEASRKALLLYIEARDQQVIQSTTIAVTKQMIESLEKALAAILPERDMQVAAQVAAAVRKQMRDEAGPIEVRITNAAELQRDTILSIKRDDTGKMSGATAMKV